MRKKLSMNKVSRAIAATSMAAVLMTTGISAAALETDIGGASIAMAAVQSENRYEAFLGYDDSFAMLNQSYDSGNVNLWSGNFMTQYTLPHGNLYRNLPLTLTYNSQANCNIGLGNNVVMNYWAQLTQIDANTIKVMTGTGTIDTFVKNTVTGQYENGIWKVEEQEDGGYYSSNIRGNEYYFDARGNMTRTHVGYSYITVTYNAMGYIEQLGNQEGVGYRFIYQPSPNDHSLQCVVIESNYPTMLEYDNQGNLIRGFQMDVPGENFFEYQYGENNLMTSFSSYGSAQIPVVYQAIDGYDKVSNFDGTQIVYGKNQTISIAPDGTMTTWQFDDNGNWINR